MASSLRAKPQKQWQVRRRFCTPGEWPQQQGECSAYWQQVLTATVSCMSVQLICLAVFSDLQPALWRCRDLGKVLCIYARSLPIKGTLTVVGSGHTKPQHECTLTVQHYIPPACSSHGRQLSVPSNSTTPAHVKPCSWLWRCHSHRASLPSLSPSLSSYLSCMPC